MVKIIIHIVSLLFFCNLLLGQHPCLTLTKEGVAKVKAGLGNVPLFDAQLSKIKEEVDQGIEAGIQVPIPKDMAGGYTHEQHKVNYKLMSKAGNLYQFTGNEKYANFIKEMLLEYAELYPKLPLHPTMKSYSTGKIFWQCLNDANWLMFTSQAYDCIYDFLSQDERKHLENDLFIPFANFLSIENPRFFNRIHNHSTWATSAVGMIALAMNNDTLLAKALYGLENDGVNPDELDNDGGYIKKDGVRQAGFLAQLDYSFSPDGYFTEGPYYQRYAILPFLVFGHALHNNKPDLKIFEYRDGILAKATKSLLQLTDPQGNFFPFNDAQKGMNFKSHELVTAVDLMYFIDGSEKSLLEWAALQEKVSFNEAGYFMAKNLYENTPEKPSKQPALFADGVNGDEGAVAVMRMNNTDLFFKFASHGMGHGHYDRLSYSIYDSDGEILQDYGAVRWVNVEPKGGGRYLPENKTFGKQTIGHNTATINQKSQFGAKIRQAEETSPILYYSDFSQPEIQLVSAIENNAYANVSMHRTIFMMEDEKFSNPIILDLFALSGNENIEIDLPFWYQGHVMKTSFDYEKELENLTTLGDADGYQHIWKEASGLIRDKQYSFNWFGNERFYTLSGVSNSGDEMILGRAGANDPNFNLRNDPVLIHRKSGDNSAIFFNIIESHGKYNRITEIPSKLYGAIEELLILYADENYIVCTFSTANDKWEICFSLNDNAQDSTHGITIDNKEYNWTGVYKFKKIKN